MTPLMNSVSINNAACFSFLFFKQHCSLNNVDLSGNTILHLAAKNNSIGIAKILKHIYIECMNPNSAML